jgi:hypothetical protein
MLITRTPPLNVTNNSLNSCSDVDSVILCHVLSNYFVHRCFIKLFIIFCVIRFCVISGFRCEIAGSGDSLLTFRDNI